MRNGCTVGVGLEAEELCEVGDGECFADWHCVISLAQAKDASDHFIHPKGFTREVDEAQDKAHCKGCNQKGMGETHIRWLGHISLRGMIARSGMKFCRLR
jgi:hypothetical protein